jgi:hypothetical protein
LQDNLELAGRVAGRGNSQVGIGIILGIVFSERSAAQLKNALAKPNQVVAPAQVRL